jgi:uncharacterized protein (DUF58 family)
VGFLPTVIIGLNELSFIMILGYDLLLLFLCILDLALSTNMKDIDIRRIYPAKLSLGKDNTIRIRIRNLSRYRCWVEIKDDHPPSFISTIGKMRLSISPSQEREVTYTVNPTCRGKFRFGHINIRITGRLGLITKSFRIQRDDEVNIYPNILSIKQYRAMTTLHRLAQLGFHPMRRTGIGTEFESLREYQVDDEYKRIDWKATSRVAHPITQLYQTERSQNILIGLDTSRMMATRIDAISKLDYAINSALLLAFVAGRQDDRVGLFLFSHELEGFISPKKGRSQFKSLLEALYNVESSYTEVDYLGPFKFVAHKNKRRSLIVLFTDLLDENASTAFMKAVPVLSKSHLVMCVVLQDPAIEGMRHMVPNKITDLYEKAAATMIRREEEEILARVKARGVIVLESHPKRLDVELINKYIELKLYRRI